LLFVFLKVPKCEIFDLVDSRDFCTMKPPWKGVFRYFNDFEVCSAKILNIFWRTLSMRKQRCSKMRQNHRLLNTKFSRGEGKGKGDPFSVLDSRNFYYLRIFINMFGAEPEFVNQLSSPGIDSQPGGIDSWAP
jgi:hypothetical protein